MAVKLIYFLFVILSVSSLAAAARKGGGHTSLNSTQLKDVANPFDRSKPDPIVKDESKVKKEKKEEKRTALNDTPQKAIGAQRGQVKNGTTESKFTSSIPVNTSSNRTKRTSESPPGVFPAPNTTIPVTQSSNETKTYSNPRPLLLAPPPANTSSPPPVSIEAPASSPEIAPAPAIARPETSSPPAENSFAPTELGSFATPPPESSLLPPPEETDKAQETSPPPPEEPQGASPQSSSSPPPEETGKAQEKSPPPPPPVQPQECTCPPPPPPPPPSDEDGTTPSEDTPPTAGPSPRADSPPPQTMSQDRYERSEVALEFGLYQFALGATEIWTRAKSWAYAGYVVPGLLMPFVLGLLASAWASATLITWKVFKFLWNLGRVRGSVEVGSGFESRLQGLFRFWTKLHNSSSANSTPNLIINRPTEEESLSLAAAASLLFEQLAVLIWETGIWVVKHPGFLLERLALLTWFCGAEFRDNLIDYWILQSCHTIFFPFLNIYFAWNGYSKEFQHDFHHQKKKNRPSSEQDTYKRAELVLFWVERLGFFTLTLGWLFIKIVIMTVIENVISEDDLYLSRSITIIGGFWTCPNLLYLVMYIARRRLVALQLGHGNKKNMGFWLLNSFKKHPGFWSERLSLLIFAFGLHSFIDPLRIGIGYQVLDLCFSIIFPLLHVYFAWFGYSNEFQLHHIHHVLQESAKVEEKDVQHHRNLALTGSWMAEKIHHQCDQEENRNLMDKKEDLDQEMMLKSVDEKLHTLNVMLEQLQAKVVRIEDSLQTKKVVEKYEEEINELKAKLSAATASSQLYRTLLHESGL
ncbi:OLC1v1038138C1 [Oldenlandia corymbosa var. corymbosa]|uniref:OLC1v1038138C1 n=1 Tax=Oldenlandia corymbosa var. corymbosa TaxID=529605 RepID=A0AAV1D2W0_OLDCO|nr:OLC1v1038138C1 [Oldenlandia corymbosa var. corymbosa]